MASSSAVNRGQPLGRHQGFCKVVMKAPASPAGAFSTKGDAVHRRDELINAPGEATAPATPAGEVASTDQAETADLGVDVD